MTLPVPALPAPSLPLPEPLRASEMGTFTHYSVVTRLPEIARRALAENEFTPEAAAAVQALLDEIPNGAVRALRVPPQPALGPWEAYTAPYLGMDWLEIPWFFAEEYFYARLLEASGFFNPPGLPGNGRDPFALQKRLGLETSRTATARLAELSAHLRYAPDSAWRGALTRLLLADLWGNQNDLSLWPAREGEEGSGSAGAAGSTGSAGSIGAAGSMRSAGAHPDEAEALAHARAHLLADDTPALLNRLAGAPSGGLRVDVLLDNAGFELVADLALTDYLLGSGLCEQVTLHAKTYPVFVSDALDADVHATLDFLALSAHAPSQALAYRLRALLVEGRLRLERHPFWTSPLPLWEMPDELAAGLESADWIISKGDANYRRLLGDRHWPLDLPFARVVDYTKPAVLALRTLKSEIAVGLDPARLPQGDPRWMSNGRWGLIQLAPGTRDR